MLVGEPFYLSLAEIGALTTYQVNEIYGHARDKDGKLVITGGPKALSYRELFFHVWKQRGLDEGQTKKRWKEYVARKAEEAKAKRKRSKRS